MQVESSAIRSQCIHASGTSVQVAERAEILDAARNPGASPASAGGPDSVSFIDSRTLVAAWIYEFFTGRKAPFLRATQIKLTRLPAPDSAASISYSRGEVRRKAESTTFTAEGTVRMKSGTVLAFSLALFMNREQTQVNGVSFQSGNMSDPLVVNLDGLGARLSAWRTEFDLDDDGSRELIATLAAGSAWLARDANAVGRIDKGAELFGPLTGNGFAELAALDWDHNGWIDEGDADYSRMGLWQDGRFTPLRDAGIGALSTARVDTPFTEEQGQEVLGQVRASAVYLTESGQAGALQEVALEL